MKPHKRLRPGTVLVLGFFLIIMLGALLLSLPVSVKEEAREGVSFLDCLFVSASAVCVTGLTTIDIADTFTLTGRAVMFVLIELGGLGFASFAVFVLSLLGRNISLDSRNLAREALNYDTGNGVINLVSKVMKYSFTIQFSGALLLFLPFYRRSGNVLGSAGMAVFHSASAFNNAGFDLNGGFSSLMSFQGDVYVNIVVAVLIILGGLGFFVMSDVIHTHRWRKFCFHTKIVLVMTAGLLAGGMILFMAGGSSPLEAFFLSATARTAGFSTIDLTSLPGSSTMVMIFLMFIGASPGSTGGGIKTTTMFTIILMVFSVAGGRKPTAFRRRIPSDSIIKAFTVFVSGVMVIMAGTMLIMFIEGDRFAVMDVLFETVSAFATVGLSRSLTPLLSAGSRIVIMVLMFIGRLGPLTVAALLAGMKQERLGYIEEHILIG